MLIEQLHPAFEFLFGEAITLTGFVESEKAAAHGGDDLRLAAGHPTAGRCGWQPIEFFLAVRNTDDLDRFAMTHKTGG
jgi:hypothetical protein